nr:hypothetical protein [Bacillus thuringiensis]
MHEHKLQDITVTAICKKAGVAKSHILQILPQRLRRRTSISG